MGKAVILAAANDSDIEINNFIVRSESDTLNKNVGEFHFNSPDEYVFESEPSKDFDLIIDFATRDDIEKRIEFLKDRFALESKIVLILKVWLREKVFCHE